MTPPSAEFLDDWLARTAELVDKYQPQLVWFDWWIAQPRVPPEPAASSPPSTTTAARSGSKASPSTTRSTAASRFPDTAGVLDIERGQLAASRPLFWQTDTVGVQDVLGLRRRTTSTRRWTPSWTTSSTS